jgi:hypothetical protein
MENIKKEIANCLRQMLEGKVSWDHLIEEFRRHKDIDIAEVVELVDRISQKRDRYSKAIDIDEEEKKKIEVIIKKLEKAC